MKFYMGRPRETKGLRGLRGEKEQVLPNQGVKATGRGEVELERQIEMLERSHKFTIWSSVVQDTYIKKLILRVNKYVLKVTQKNTKKKGAGRKGGTKDLF